MNKYKVYVYAICKNEEKFVHNWIKSMSEADGIYVLDTGSTDNTVQLLLDEGVNVVSKKIVPWTIKSKAIQIALSLKSIYKIMKQ